MLAGTGKRPAELPHVEPAGELPPAMPEETARALRRLLAEMLVRDYLADCKGRSRDYGHSAPGNVIPPGAPVVGDADGKE
jgi:hypothetical protein